jgi:hypothetical protein
MYSKPVLPILLGIIAISITQFAYAEESGNSTYIAVNEIEVQQPNSRHHYQEITIVGYVEEYIRGDNVTITVVYPDESEEEISTYATKKGDLHTFLQITHESQVGTYMLFLDYDAEIAFTSFEILESD